MTTEEKFNAAVNVIRSLPKNGSYQPSTELMLRFYAYYKQATQGPCSGSRPAFWDVVGRAKYDAWKRLGDMPSKDAMAKYVDELHTIVETMSYSDKVATFLEAPTNELDSINIEDLELVAGDVLERVRSQPNSPIGSREASPIRFLNSLSSSRSSSPLPGESDHDSDEEYIDTIENPEPRKPIPNGAIPNQVTHVSRSRTKSGSSNVDVSQEVSRAVQTIRSDIEKLSQKVTALETVRNAQPQRRTRSFFDLSPGLVALLIVWPFVASYLTHRLMAKRK